MVSISATVGGEKSCGPEYVREHRRRLRAGQSKSLTRQAEQDAAEHRTTAPQLSSTARHCTAQHSTARHHMAPEETDGTHLFWGKMHLACFGDSLVFTHPSSRIQEQASVMEYSYGVRWYNKQPGSQGQRGRGWDLGTAVAGRGVRIRVSNKKKSSQRLGSCHWACLVWDGLG